MKTLPLKRFKWRDDVYTSEQVADRSKLGWISQDVQSIFPKGVNAHRFEGVPIEDRKEVIEDCLSLNADQIYAVMYGGLQKVIQKIEKLERRVYGRAR